MSIENAQAFLKKMQEDKVLRDKTIKEFQQAKQVILMKTIKEAGVGDCSLEDIKKALQKDKLTPEELAKIFGGKLGFDPGCSSGHCNSW